MAKLCTVDARRSAGTPSPLDRLLIAPQRSAQRDLHRSPSQNSKESAQPCSEVDVQPKRGVTASRHPCPANPASPAMMFSGLTKRYSVLGYGDHMQGEGPVRKVPSSDSQKKSFITTHNPNTLKIMPHITRPGTSCSRPPTTDSSLHKSDQPQKMIPSMTPGNSTLGLHQQDLFCSRMHAGCADTQPQTYVAERLATCPVGKSMSRTPGGDKSGTRGHIPPISPLPPRNVCGSAPPGSHMFNILHTEVEPTTPKDANLPCATKDSPLQEPSAHPVALSGCHYSSSRPMTKTASSEIGPQKETLRTATQASSYGWRTASPACTPHSISEFYTSVEGPISSVSQSAPMVLSLEDFFQSSKEVIALEISKMSESQLERLEDNLDHELHFVNDTLLDSGPN